MRRVPKVLLSILGITLALTVASSFAIASSFAAPVQEQAKVARHHVPQAVKNFTKQALSGMSEDPSKAVKVLVHLKKDAALDSGKKETDVINAQSQVVKKIEKLTGHKVTKRLGYLVNAFEAEATPANIEAIASMPEVASVYQMPVYYPSMSTAVDVTKATEVWQSYHEQGEGMVVAVLDTGIDYDHRDFRLTNPAKATLTKEKIAQLIKDKQLPGEYHTDKVPYGYNYADANENAKPNPKNDHGMHVSGIVAANGNQQGSIKGVAPEAQVLAMKVFSDNREGADAIDLIAALEDSVKLGADVINMSLGSANGFASEDSAYQKALQSAVEAGSIVVAAAGNEGISSDPIGLNHNTAHQQDSAAIAFPGVYAGVLTVASAENSNIHASKARAFIDGDATGVEFIYNADSSGVAFDNNKHKLVYAGLGRKQDYTNEVKEAVRGNFALVMRGEISFQKKAAEAADAGALGIVVFNNKAGDNSLLEMGDVGNVPIFSAFVGNVMGQKMANALIAGKSVEASFGERGLYASPEAGAMSTFTSWGVSPELTLKPDLAAPGGHIWSTLPDNRYGEKSGTSMATPHVAGATALLLNHLKQLSASGAHLPYNKLGMVKAIFDNTSKPWTNQASENKLPFSPRQQGAGVINIDDAFKTKVVAAYEDGLGEFERPYGVISLKEVSGSKQFSVKLTNFSNENVSFEVKPGAPMKQALTNDNVPYEMLADGASLTADATSVNLAPNESKTLTFSLKTGSENNIFEEGYISFLSKTEGQPNLSMPYMAFVGSWSEEPIVDTPHQGEKRSTIEQILHDKWGEGSEVKAFARGATTLVSRLESASDDGNTVQWLGNIFDLDHLNGEHVAFSPNGDGFCDVIFPQVGLLRNAKKLSFEILDANKKVLATVGQQENLARNRIQPIVDETQRVHADSESLWDGKLYNDAFNPTQKESDTNQKYTTAPDGQYYYRIKAKITNDAKEQVEDLPFKIDTKKPTITLLSAPETEEADGQKYVAVRVQIQDNKGGSGVDPNLLSVESESGDEISPVIDFTAVDAKEGIYDLKISKLPFNYLNAIKLGVFDFASNASDFTDPFVIGNTNGVVVREGNGGALLAGTTFVKEREESDTGVGDVTTSWKSFNKQDPADGTAPYPLLIQTPENVATVEVNGVSFKAEAPTKHFELEGTEAHEGDDQEEPAEFWQTFEHAKDDASDTARRPLLARAYIALKEGVNHVTVKAFDANHQQVSAVTLPSPIVYDKTEPTISIDWPANFEHKNIDITPAYMAGKPMQDWQHAEFVFVPDDMTQVRLTARMKDNSFGWDFDPAKKQYFLTYLDTKDAANVTPDAPTLTTLVKFDWTNSKAAYEFSAMDPAQNIALKDVYFFKKSQMGDIEKLKRQVISNLELVNQRNDPDAPISSFTEGEVENENVQPQKHPRIEWDNDFGPQVPFLSYDQNLDNDELTISGNVTDIDRLEIQGQKVSFDQDGLFETKVHLNHGFNIILTRAYYTDPTTNKEVLYQANKVVVLYDSNPPTITLEKPEASQIFNNTVYSNTPDLLVKGTVSDDTVSVKMSLNGNVLVNKRDIESAGQSAQFETKLHLKHGDWLNFHLEDLFYNADDEHADTSKKTHKKDTGSSEDTDAPVDNAEPNDGTEDDQAGDSSTGDNAGEEELEEPSKPRTKHDAELSYKFYLDTQAPVIKPLASMPKEGETIELPRLVPEFKVSDNSVENEALVNDMIKVQVTLDGRPYTGLPIDGEGKHTLKVVATDLAGNSSTFTRNFSFKKKVNHPQEKIEDSTEKKDAFSGKNVSGSKQGVDTKTAGRTSVQGATQAATVETSDNSLGYKVPLVVGTCIIVIALIIRFIKKINR